LKGVELFVLVDIERSRLELSLIIVTNCVIVYVCKYVYVCSFVLLYTSYVERVDDR